MTDLKVSCLRIFFLQVFFILSLILLNGFLLISPSHAATLYLLDFDGTTVNDSGTWKTPWILVKVKGLHSTSQSPYIKNAPNTIEVSYGEYRKLVALLAKGDAALGSMQEVSLEKDPYLKRPESIVPGLYKVSPDLTYANYKPPQSQKLDESRLIQDYNEAISRTKRLKQSHEAWQGLAFPLLQRALTEEVQTSRVIFFTAREQSKEEFVQLLNLLDNKGHLKISNGPLSLETKKVQVNNLEGLESLELGRSLSERKVNAVAEAANGLLVSPLKGHSELGSLETKHTIIVAEDHPGYVIKIASKLMELSRELHFKDSIRFVLLNTGIASDLKGAQIPYRWAVFEGGFVREASPEEINNWTKINEANQKKQAPLRLASPSKSGSGLRCQRYLSAQGGN